MIKVCDLYALKEDSVGGYLRAFKYPWQALSGIKTWIVSVGKSLDKADYDEVTPQVWVHKKATVSPTAYLGAPCIIGEGTEVRHCAFIRGSAYVGKNCVVGNSVELKNVILLDGVQVPHYNYVGDSILGFNAHMGAGSITSNVKSDKSEVVVKNGDKEIKTGFKKVGAMLGDGVEVGCNAVLNPGSIVGKNTTIYPLSFVRGVLPCDSILKRDGSIVKKV